MCFNLENIQCFLYMYFNLHKCLALVFSKSLFSFNIIFWYVLTVIWHFHKFFHFPTDEHKFFISLLMDIWMVSTFYCYIKYILVWISWFIYARMSFKVLAASWSRSTAICQIIPIYTIIRSDEFSPTLDVTRLLFFACEGCDYNLHFPDN